MYMICHLDDRVMFTREKQEISDLMMRLKLHLNLINLRSPKQFLGNELESWERDNFYNFILK